MIDGDPVEHLASRLVDFLRDIRWIHERRRAGDRVAGVELRQNLVDRSVMGITKVVRALGSLVDVAASFLEDLERTRPDAVICVDYPGLNLNLARMARARGIPVIYYICPQVWAWGPWRVRRVASRADLLLVILPFEESVSAASRLYLHRAGDSRPFGHRHLDGWVE